VEQGRAEAWREGWREGELSAARVVLRQLLSHRKLAPTKDEEARIDACTDFATLERWIERADEAVSVRDVLR
jgi:hypothetical protein